MDTFNGSVDMVDPRPVTPVIIDACDTAAGGFYVDDWVYTPWVSCWPAAKNHPINYKEVLALEPAVQRWAPLWANRKVRIHTDNQAAAAIINKGSSRDPLVMESLRRIFWLSATFNFRLHAVYLPGEENVLADSVSRLHEKCHQNKLFALGLLPPVMHYCPPSIPFRPPPGPGGQVGPEGGNTQGAVLRRQHEANVHDPP